ncbi:MAG: glycosyl hydrolase, partial [Bacteroidota bacterium]
RYPSFNPISTSGGSNEDGPSAGLLAAPGTYAVTMYLSNNGSVKQLGEAVSFNVKPLYEGSLEGSTIEVASAFWRDYEATSRRASAVDGAMAKAEKTIMAMHKALANSSIAPQSGVSRLEGIRKSFQGLKSEYYGNQARMEIGEKNLATVNDKMFAVYRGISNSTYGPTASHVEQMQLIKGMLSSAETKLKSIEASITQMEQALKAAGAPYIDK